MIVSIVILSVMTFLACQSAAKLVKLEMEERRPLRAGLWAFVGLGLVAACVCGLIKFSAAMESRGAGRPLPSSALTAGRAYCVDAVSASEDAAFVILTDCTKGERMYVRFASGERWPVERTCYLAGEQGLVETRVPTGDTD